MQMHAGIAPKMIGVTPDVAFRRAVELQQHGDLAGAEQIYRAILKQHPNHFETLSNLGFILLVAERMEDATYFLRKALNQRPRAAITHTLLARALQLLDRHEEALDRARRAIALDPGLAEGHAILAQGLAELGRYDEAVSAMARAIELSPDEPRLYHYWGHITRWTPDDPRLAALRALEQKSKSKPLPLPERVELNFALAGAHAGCGDLEGSFRYQIEGGALQRQLARYDETATFREFDELARAVDSAWLSRHKGAGDPSPLPVFIVGMPRSGTTLVEQILSSHPKVRALGERNSFSDSIRRVRGMPGAPPMFGQWSGTQLRKLGALYLEASRRDVPPNVARFVDKLPANFLYAGLIHASLPNARIIHTCRDPVDTCLSVFSVLFSGTSQLYSYDLAELGRYYGAYRKLMAHWRNVLPGGVMLDVQYEDVVNDLEQQARRIIAHCGMEWDDACLEFHKTARPVRTISHAQVRQPIYRSSVGRKRPPPELLRPLLETLGID